MLLIACLSAAAAWHPAAIVAGRTPALAQCSSRCGPGVAYAASGALTRAATIEALSDQVWQLRADGLDIHVTVIREIEAELSRLLLEDSLERLQESLYAPAVPADPLATELNCKLRARACSSLSQTAVPPALRTTHTSPNCARSFRPNPSSPARPAYTGSS